jgi:DHA3 family tetracycline resistance protein-like MFS transporter
MSLLEMNSINACFMIFGIFSEIPTGSFADSFSRKKSIVIGYFLISASFLIYFYSYAFWFFVTAEINGAFGNSFVSGAMEAWAIDSLKFHNYGGSLQKVFKHESDFRVAGFGLGGLFGAYLGSIDISYPWLAGSISFLLLGAIFSIVLKEEYFVRHKEENGWSEKMSHWQAFRRGLEEMKKVARDGLAFSWKKRAIFYIMLFGSVYTLVVQAINMQWQLVFKGTFELNIMTIGWLYLGMSIFMLMGNQLIMKFSQMGQKEECPVILSQIFTLLGISLAAFVPGIYAFSGGMMIHQIGRAMLEPLKKNYINQRIGHGRLRATINSLSSMLVKIGAFIGLTMSGYLAENYSIILAWQVSAAILLVSIPVFLKLNYKDRK